MSGPFTIVTLTASMKELEVKYLLVPARKPRKALRRLLRDLSWAGFQAQPQSTRLVHDVYFDTSDQRLHHAGWSLRSRRTERGVKLTCKQFNRSREGWFQRQEVEQLCLGGIPSLADMGDGPVHDLLRRYVPLDAIFEPLFEQDNQRTAYLVTHEAHPRSAVELVMDRVRVDGRADDQAPLDYVEFEGELKQGDAGLLEAFAAVLANQKRVIRSRTTKYHRGLFFTGRQLLPRADYRTMLSPRHAFARLGACYYREQLQALITFEPFAWEGLQPEGVHLMRVANRRAHSALKALDRMTPEGVDGLAKEFGWLGHALGTVRDLDVQKMRIDDYRARPTENQEVVLERMVRHRDLAHRAAREELRAALASARFTDMLERIQCLQRQLAAGPPDASPTIEDAARTLITRRLRTVRKAGRRISADSPPADLHRLRILIKRLRYQLEIFNGPYGSELGRAFRVLRRLQNRLGDYQDTSVAVQELSDYRARQARGRKARKAIDRLITLETEKGEALRSRFGRDWQRFEKETRSLERIFQRAS